MAFSTKKKKGHKSKKTYKSKSRKNNYRTKRNMSGGFNYNNEKEKNETVIKFWKRKERELKENEKNRSKKTTSINNYNTLVPGNFTNTPSNSIKRKFGPFYEWQTRLSDPTIMSADYNGEVPPDALFLGYNHSGDPVFIDNS